VKWRPQDVVALVLAIAIFVSFAGFMISRLLGVDVAPEYLAMAWKDLLMALTGGLIGYVSGNSEGE